MFIAVLIEMLLPAFAVAETTEKPRPYVVFPVPFDLPNRNDRSDQCWLRIEDLEVVETVTVYCFIAHAFLRSHIHDYNLRKMQEDDVGVANVSAWNEESRRGDILVRPAAYPNNIKDWKTTTVLDPTVNRRIYVTKMADCRLVMYSREGMTNYKVNCERILNFVNTHTSRGIKSFNFHIQIILIISVVLLFVF